jgi:hypothetical protein
MRIRAIHVIAENGLLLSSELQFLVSDDVSVYPGPRQCSAIWSPTVIGTNSRALITGPPAEAPVFNRGRPWCPPQIGVVTTGGREVQTGIFDTVNAELSCGGWV